MDPTIDKPRILAQFKSENGDVTSAPLDLPLDITVDQLQLVCNAIIKTDKLQYSFFVQEEEITQSLGSTLEGRPLETESVLDIVYQPQAVFKVKAVTRCTSSLPGHGEAVIAVSFSPDGRYLASGSGDTTVRFWDIHTETPQFTCQSHRHWVLCIAWSPDGSKLASACKIGQIIIWNPVTGNTFGPILTAHRQWVTALSWEPLHRNPDCRRLASASKDGTIRIWDVILGQTLICLSGHTQGVTCLRWGGSGLIYSGSQDRSIRVWRPDDGILCRILQGHAHWVNTLALSTDYVMRTGAFDPSIKRIDYNEVKETREVLYQRALKRYQDVIGIEPERMVSGSDDFTLMMWLPDADKKPVTRMTGHQQLVNDVRFSPDTRLVASASFDKSIKLWDGRTGRYLASLRGHVSAVYQVAWSADCRLLVSGSSDSTLKVWDMQTKRIAVDLPGHADEVYAVDWSPDGERVASGGKDKVLKIWRQ